VSDDLQPIFCFPSVVVTALKPEFLDAVNAVSDEYLAQQSGDLNEIYPAKMSGDFSQDPRLRGFCEFIGKSAWEILRNQGSDMQNANTFFTEMWTQEHHKHSAMEQHVHGNGAQLVGFYFLETPENCSKALFYDPRAGKVQANLPEANMGEITPASNTIGFEAQPGTMIFANAWLPHGFTRHGSDKPIKFVHFNINVEYAAAQAAEVI
jgi:uncharacterized protein (TIGR02466 family)